MKTTIDMRITAATVAVQGKAASVSSSLNEVRYHVGATELVNTGAVCLQPAPLSLGSSWAGAMSGAAAAKAGRLAAVRPSSDFFKPLYGSQASDGTG
ncbi:hypothetical protein GCM10022223_37670 [Kineosporia mesophila]|uniref:Uncharacterized protein n=1 Tax=Kineosporia mesophila TaxID=566012 RepID=A0ABP6ZQY7_9ACTN|nr:hypothetical protein [Kineosporia mesophila]MCD5349809.1 hypothetical protein [Kineosporia mesophila]